ncbi:DUF2442 domain-containing protein [Pseudescherichia sp.]|uniref:DUF2442 domain-containing protein n=1 Tax=Pseudescherichia sp. TaxID=2055881 RepID=UPI0028AEFC29|nr:DUF2442 domain-containing protein [Pseudescherichia sp.]
MTALAKDVSFNEHKMWIELSDARTLGVPLAWSPKLLHASPDERNNFKLSRRGIHWDSLDEDISIEGLLAGRGDVTFKPHSAA